MKKHFLSMLAMASMLFATSCSDEENIAESNSQNVTFTVELEKNGTASRAIDTGVDVGKGYYVDQLYYAVYEDGKNDLLIKNSVSREDNGTFKVTIPLVNNLDFDIVFFAHDKDASAFEVPPTGDLRDITFKTSLLANQETYDAFSEVITHKATSKTVNEVELKRITAQLNVAGTLKDLKDADALNANATHSKVVLKGVPTSFDARTKTASNPQDVTFETSAILKNINASGELENEILTCNSENFYYLAMAYVLANEQSGLYDSQFTFYRANENDPTVAGDVVSIRNIPNLPLQRNYRTNVTGSILTQNENFSITLDTKFGEHDNQAHDVEANEVTVVSDADLNNLLVKQAAVAKEMIMNIKFDAEKYEDDNQTVDITIPATGVNATSITLNFLDFPANSKLNVVGESYDKPVVISIPDNLTISETTIDILNAHVTLKDGTHTTVYSSTSSNTLEVAGGTIVNNLVVNQGNVEIKNEGTVKKISAAVGVTVKVSVELGAELNEIEGNNIKVETTLADTDEWVLTEDVELLGSITVAAGKTLTIDLNGYTISQTKVCTESDQMIYNKGNLTIKDTKGNGKISFNDISAGDPNYGWGSYTVRNEGTLIVEGGKIEHLGEQEAHMICAIFQYSGSTTINGGTISTPNYRSARLWSGDMTINGGTFEGQLWLQSVNDTADLTINGGSFAPRRNDSSSVFVTNENHDVKFAVTGGKFETKIGCSDANKLVGAITGGTFTATAKEGTNAALFNNAYKLVESNGFWTLVGKEPVAKIGEVEYTTLQKAVNAVQDGETITLVANETFTENNRYNNGGYWDGLGYSGDKSFTIDLGGNTISQNGALNDYLIWIKNDGAKANTITLKNGTLDAGTTAYCAFATSSSNKQKITVNLEDINLINNNAEGAVVKARGGSELNVKAGTIITGKNSYTGIEAVGNNTIVNIYDGAEIYQEGTTNYVGAIVGASYNATMNIYGGKGQSAKCGIIVMSTGATINVSGGEWIANGDGTVAGDNQAVLVSQNNRYESGWACKSILNVTGGTFKGGYNCYGMGPGVEADDAQINIKGGNFNADPAQYVVAGYEATEVTGGYTVGKPQALADLEAAIENGGNVTLTNDVTLIESIVIENKVVLDLNGKTITAPLFSAFEVKDGGDLTIKNGKVVAYESTVRAIGGKATIESGEYTSTGTALDTPSTYCYSLDCRKGGELIVNGGTFKSNNGMINVGSTVTINGGKFENIVEKSMTRHFAYVSALLTINDGEFFGKANSGAGGCFFCGAAAGGDIQVNGGKFTSLWTTGSVNGIFEVYFGGTINVTGGMFNTNRGITNFVVENTDEATKDVYPYVAK